MTRTGQTSSGRNGDMQVTNSMAERVTLASERARGQIRRRLCTIAPYSCKGVNPQNLQERPQSRPRVNSSPQKVNTPEQGIHSNKSLQHKRFFRKVNTVNTVKGGKSLHIGLPIVADDATIGRGEIWQNPSTPLLTLQKVFTLFTVFTLVIKTKG